MKGCIFGNSHAAMLITAHRELLNQVEKKTDLDFFVMPGIGPVGFEIKHNTIVAVDPKLITFLNKIGEPTRVELSDYDFIVIVGCGTSIYPVVHMVSKQQIWGWPSNEYDGALRSTIPHKNRQLPIVSEYFLEEVIEDYFTRTFAYKLGREIRQRTAVKAFLVPQPRPSVRLLDMSDKGRLFRNIVKLGDGEKCANVYEAALLKSFTNGLNFKIIPQSHKTIQKFLFTGNRFTTNSVRLYNLNKKFGSSDVLHANSLYGRLVLSQISTALV